MTSVRAPSGSQEQTFDFGALSVQYRMERRTTLVSTKRRMQTPSDAIQNGWAADDVAMSSKRREDVFFILFMARCGIKSSDACEAATSAVPLLQ